MFDIRGLYRHSADKRVLLAAEIGINHEGSYDYARRLVEIAKKSGADAVKFQVFRAGGFINPKASPDAFKLFQSLELSFDDFARLKEWSESLGLVFFATPLCLDSINFLSQIGNPIYKIASSDLTCHPFLAAVRAAADRSGAVVALSTGMSTLAEIKRGCRIFDKDRLVVLYCVSKYPADPLAGDFDLNFIKTLARAGYTPGFSDHSRGIALSLAGAALGARLIERHFTDDPSKINLDHGMSLGPDEFRRLAAGIRECEAALGNGGKIVTDFEKKIRRPSMRGMYSARPLAKGSRPSPSDVVFLRPGDGVTLSEYKKRLSSNLVMDIEAYEKI